MAKIDNDTIKLIEEEHLRKLEVRTDTIFNCDEQLK